MQRHQVTFEVDAPPRTVWRAFHPRLVPPPGEKTLLVEYPGGSIEILNPGDEHGEGLVRTCTFAVPRWLGTGGMARSWELVDEIRVEEYAHYRAIGKPLWTQAEGSHLLEPLDGGTRTRLTFTETYHCFNPLVRWTLERPVHRFISANNDATYVSVLSRVGAVTRI